MAEKKETAAEKKEDKKVDKKELANKATVFLKKMLELDPVLTDKIGDKLQKQAKGIYYGLLILTLLYALATWVTLGFFAFLIQAAVYFTLVRLFCEKLAQK